VHTGRRCGTPALGCTEELMWRLQGPSSLLCSLSTPAIPVMGGGVISKEGKIEARAKAVKHRASTD